MYAAHTYIYLWTTSSRVKDITRTWKKIPQHLWQQSHKLSWKKSAEINNYIPQELWRPRGEKTWKTSEKMRLQKTGISRTLKQNFHTDYFLSEWMLKSFLVFNSILRTLSFRTPPVVNMLFKWATDGYELEEKPSSPTLFPKTDSTALGHSWHTCLACS